jgi:hypothetical protein
MFLKLILLFILTPLIELAILVYLGTVIGALYTILIVVATGILGGQQAYLELFWQGIRAWRRFPGFAAVSSAELYPPTNSSTEPQSLQAVCFCSHPE